MRVKIRCVKIVNISVRGNKSKQVILSATERFRCHSLASGRFRCWVSASGQFRCFLILPRLCGQVGHYEIALSVDNYEAVDLTLKEVVTKGAIPVLGCVVSNDF